jgi:hypothetical protein
MLLSLKELMSFKKLLRAGAAMAVLCTTPVMAGSYPDGGEPLPWRGSTKDDGYPVPQPPAAEYAPPRDAYRPRAPRCLSKVELRDALNGQGWHAFDAVEYRGNVAFMTARSDGGRRFDLQVDSCSGQVIESHPRVVYVEQPAPPPRDYYYYAPRPAYGMHFYGGGPHRHWR